MAKTPSRPSSFASSGSDATPQRFGSGRWREASRVSGIRFKICLCGMQGVGKTSIFKRLLGEGFTDLKPTPNVSTFEYKDKGDERIEYSVWDTNGFEGRNSLTLGDHYQNAHCILLVFDSSDMKSLKYLEDELEMIQRKQYSPYSKFILIQNKTDLPEDQQMTFDEQKNYIQDTNFIKQKVDFFCKTSAKSNQGIDELFHEAIPEQLILPEDELDTPVENGNGNPFDEFLDFKDGKKKKKKRKKRCKQM